MIQQLSVKDFWKSPWILRPKISVLGTVILLCCMLTGLPVLAQQHTVSGFSPSAGYAGETITISGTNFSSITGVSLGGVAAASYSVVSPTKITAVIAAGASTGPVSVTKSGVSTATVNASSNLNYLSLPTVTSIVTDHGGFWNTNTTVNNAVYPDSAHNLLSFTYGGITYSTGLKDNTLVNGGVSYTPGNWKALPAILSGNTSGASLFIATGAKMDGNLYNGLYTHPAIKDLTIQSVLSDGLGGLNLGSGYTNLPATATSSFNIYNVVPGKITDNEPDILVTQIADPPSGTIDIYQFVDASNNPVGNSIAQDLSKVPPLGTWYLDLFSVPAGVPVGTAKPSAVSSSMTTRNIRLVAYRLSDFGITASNYTQIKQFKITPSGTSDVAFVAYNANAINVPPSITQNTTATSSVICASGGNAYLAVTAISAAGGTLSYSWEVSTDNGNSWYAISDNSTYSGSATDALSITNATSGRQYRATVTESISNYSSKSSVFTITTAAGSALGGTLNPTATVSNCLNATTGTTSLSVSPTGGTGSYSYQWLSSATSGGTYTAIPGAIYSSYSFPLSTAGTTYYKVQVLSGCYSNTSSASAVTLSGESITGVTNGVVCAPGSVTLGAAATGGTINWYATNNSGTVLQTGNSYSPTVSASTTYFVSVTSGGCTSARVPVTATVANNITIDSSNTRITYATDVCSGSASNVVVATTALANGTYTVTYDVSGANTITNGTATMTVSGGNGSFSTAALNNVGSNLLKIVSVTLNSCTVTASNANSYPVVVNSGAPDASNFSISVGNGCSNANATATISSTTLASGNYTVNYYVTGDNSVAVTSAPVVFTAGNPGTGTFQLPLLGNAGSNNTLTITTLALTSSPACAATLNQSSNSFTNSILPVVDAGSPRTMCASAVSITLGPGADASNYDALTWSTSDGTGSFSNNTTADALTTAAYTPSAADISAGSRLLTLTATGSTGCANVAQTVSLTIKSGYIWYGTTSSNWNTASNWQCNDVPTPGANVTIVASPPHQPQIQNDVEVGNIVFGSNSYVDLNGSEFKISGAITGTPTFKSTSTSSLVFSGTNNATYYFASGSGNNNIGNLTVNASGVTITQGADTMIVHGTVSVTAGVLNLSAKNVRLKSVAAYTARIARITGAIVNGSNLTVERFVPAKPGRRWSSMACPVNALLSTSWQQDIHITGPGTGGTACNSYATNMQPGTYTNGFDATQTNANSFYYYANNSWVAIPNTNSTNLAPGVGYYVNVRGDRNTYGCQLLQYTNSQTGGVPTYDATVKATGALTKGNVTVNATNTGYWFLGNPYPCEIDFNSFYAENSANISQMYWLYDPANISGNYMTWDGTNYAGAAAGYTNHELIASGQGFFVNITTTGSLTFRESHKSSTYQSGGFKTTTSNDKIRINIYKAGDTLKQDDALVVFDRDSLSANTALTAFDAKTLNAGDVWVATMKGADKLAIQKRYESYAHDTVDVFAYVANAGNYSFDFTDISLAGTVYLQDNLTNTMQDLAVNPQYAFSVAAAGNVQNRFRLLFDNNSPLAREEVVLTGYSHDARAHLNWHPATPGNYTRYSVQSSDDGTVFQSIETIAAHNEQADNQYYYTDATELTGKTRFYRVKAIRPDGSAAYSHVLALGINTAPVAAFRMYPNPVSDELHVSFSGDVGHGYIRIISSSGVQLVQVAHSGADLSINTKQLPRGAYIVEVTGDGFRQTQPLIK